LHRQQCSL